MPEQPLSSLNSLSHPSGQSILHFLNRKHGLYEAVISAQRWNEIEHFLDQVPLSITDFWGYELRLHDPHAPVDFLVCIGRHHAKVLGKSLTEGSLSLFQWNSLSHFVELWKQESHLFYRTVKNIWLEMDADEMRKGQPVHNLFYAPDPLLSQLESNHTAREFWEAFDVKLSASVWDQFEICQNSLPAGAIISQIGVMLARDKESLRFFAQGMDKNELFAYLDKIGWKNDTLPLQRLMATLHPFIETWGLNIELNEGGLRDGIGIECYLSAHDLSKLEGLLNIFQNQGLMTTEIQGTVHQYAIQCSQQPMEKYTEFAHHFKISYRADGNMGGKVYLGVMKNTQFFINTLRHLVGNE